MRRKKIILMCIMLMSMLVLTCGCEFKLSGAGNKKKLVKKGTLTIATNAYFPPYEYYSGDMIVGIDAEIGQAIADKLDLKLKLEDMSFDKVIDSVRDGECDIALSAITITDERKKEVDFSDSYASGIQSIIVKEDSEIKNDEDLKNAAVIGVQKGATGESYCTDDFGEDKIRSYNKMSVAILDLDEGSIDAIVVDQDAAIKYAQENVGLKVLDTEYVREDYGIVVGKGNKLKDDINKALKELKDEGKIEEIRKKYIEQVEE